MDFRSFMHIALDEARAAADRGEVPVGAVIAGPNGVVAQAGNRTRELHDPTAHAEVLAILPLVPVWVKNGWRAMTYM